MKKLIVSLLCLMLATGGLYSAQPIGDENEMRAKKLISIDFPGTSLSTVISVLSAKTGYKFITDSELAEKRIVLTLRDVTVEEALSALLDTYNLYYVRQGETNIYVIKSKTDTIVTTVSKVFFLNYPTAKNLEPTLKNKLSKNGAISSDEKSNSIIVTDTADNIEEIDQLIKTLDIPPLQVLLECKVIDVKIDNSIQYGANLTMYRTNKYYTSPLAVQQANAAGATLSATAVQPQALYGQALSPGLMSGNSPSGGGLQVSLLQGDMNVQAYLEALKTDTNSKIISNPRILVLNNQEASLDIIEELPYQQSTTTSLAGTGTSQSTIAFKEVGIKLTVKPQISRDGMIILAVSPEDSYDTGRALDNTPIVYTSKSHTVFMLENGETAVISGLVKENDSNTEDKIPLLGDIPILGYLFKKVNKDKTRNELTILITAKIVK